jgi:acetylornithine deacetylase
VRAENELASLAWIQHLIRLDTTSRRSNLALIDTVEAEAGRLGLPAVRISSLTEPKANLWVTVPAADGRTAGGIVLSGHTDTVPVDGQDWHSDPFSPTVRDERLYGRGSCDMKGFIGVVLERLGRFVTAELSEPLHLALSYDEELGCQGAGAMIDEMAHFEIRPRACIVGEPTGMRAITGHKSISIVELTFRGVAAHSSLTSHGVNAIEYAAQAIDHIRAMASAWQQHGPFDPAYALPFSTASVNLVSGGIAANTVPDLCTLTFEIRTVAAQPPRILLDEIEQLVGQLGARMHDRHASAGASMHVVASVPGLDVAPESPAASLCHAIGGIPAADKVTYSTEAGMFDVAGIPSIVCGPGEIAQAHRADEWVSLEQLAACEAMIDRLLVQMTEG